MKKKKDEIRQLKKELEKSSDDYEKSIRLKRKLLLTINKDEPLYDEAMYLDMHDPIEKIFDRRYPDIIHCRKI